MSLRAEIDGVTVTADTAEELASLIRALRGGVPGPSQLPIGKPAPPRTQREAMKQVFHAVKDPNYRKALMLLAGRGAEGATNDELKTVCGIDKRLSGFSGSVLRLAEALGLKAQDVMISSALGVVAGQRRYRYLVTAPMAEAVSEAAREDMGQKN
jgi:hypothetical protein